MYIRVCCSLILFANSELNMNENTLFVWLFTAPRRARAYSLPCSFILMFVHGLVFANEYLQKARQPAAPLRNIQRFAKNKKKSGPPARRLIFRRRLHPCTCGPSSPSSARDVLPPCSARATSRSSRCAAHEQARASSIPRGLRPGAQEKTFVVRAPKPAENGKAPSTPSSSSSARGVFVGRCVRDADVPRRDGAAPPGTGATTTTRSRVSFCRLVCRFNEGAGGG